MNSFYNTKQDWIKKHINDLISEGLKQMGNPALDENMFRIWLDYSKQVLEITTRDYNAAILLNYLRVIMSINPQLPPSQKVGICLDYLIGVLRIIQL